MFKAIKKVLSKIKDIAIKSLNVFYDFVEEVEEEMVAVEEVRLEEKKLYFDMAKFVMNWLSSGARYVLKSASNGTKSVLKDDENTMIVGVISTGVAVTMFSIIALRKLIKT